MSISMAMLSLSSPPSLHIPYKLHLLPTHKPTFPFLTKNPLSLSSSTRVSSSSAPGGGAGTTVEEKDKEASTPRSGAGPSSNGAVAGVGGDDKEQEVVKKFVDPRWIKGTWDLKQFVKDSKTDWDAVIDAEVRRRKWLEENPESTSNDDLVVFETSIIPWWAWMKRFHLPEAELLNGRAAMIGFFMAYLVDSLTGIGLVDQMSNFFCKTLLFVAVVGVLLIRKNEDVENLKKLIEETNFYDKQWQATWQDETSGGNKMSG